MSTQSRWGLTKVLYIVRSAYLGMRHWSLRNKPMILFILLNTSLRSFSNGKRLSCIIPRYFCEVSCYYTVIKSERRIRVLVNFSTENNLLSLFARIWIGFHWCPHWLLLSKPLLSSASELFTLSTTKNNEASSANNLAVGDNSSARSFMFIKNSSGPSIETYWTLVLHNSTLKLVRLNLLSVFCPLKHHIISLKAHQTCHFVLIWK